MSDDDDECPELVEAKVPVVILTGFLGSGKTTLLQYILTQEHGLKIAVIVNEFEFGRSIEKGLTVRSSERDDDDWLELNNGCLCCTAKTQTVLALESLVARRGSLDLILVETSGLADPAPVAQMFWQDAALLSSLRLAGVVTVVDAVRIEQYLRGPERREAQQQLLVADRVLLNKEDLLPAAPAAAAAAARAAVEAAVAAVNPAADRRWTAFSRIDSVAALLGMSTADGDAAAYAAAKGPAVAAAAAVPGARHSTGVMCLHVEVAGMVVPDKHAVDMLYSRLLYEEAAADGEEAADSEALGGVVNSGGGGGGGGGVSEGVVGGSEAATEAAGAGPSEAAGAGPSAAVSRLPGRLRFDIVRSKAALWVGGEATGGARAFQAQSIGDTFDVQPMADALGGGLPPLTSRFLFFGRRLRATELRDAVHAAFRDVPGSAAAAVGAVGAEGGTAVVRESDWAGTGPSRE